MPMSVIHRPLISELDEDKVLSLMDTLKSNENYITDDTVPAIDVLWVVGKNPNNNYYYSFGGCHRHEAHKRLGLNTIKAKIIKTTPEQIRLYLGSSTPEFL
ncbi:BEACH domain-containing protein [Tieghemostelium lacteum]|uniref:Sulfiredoxin n=1 Tax=Tieghemostelium lacteum TaxID=361077 RepID=A0A151Z9F3_TIELA|nr:BEACH domain-containing protein [Tieghemostelium lacteum]|eukprot:KYQ90580.1 BEACH domain-containing protein [Tieghemostelium lacteum]